MWISILINIAISITIIIIGHYLWNYLKDTYSDKVTKDILGSQTQKYKAIINELQRTQQYESFMTDPEENLLNHNDPLLLDPTLTKPITSDPSITSDPLISDPLISDPLISDLAKDLEDFLKENIDKNK